VQSPHERNLYQINKYTRHWCARKEILSLGSVAAQYSYFSLQQAANSRSNYLLRIEDAKILEPFCLPAEFMFLRADWPSGGEFF